VSPAASAINHEACFARKSGAKSPSAARAAQARAMLSPPRRKEQAPKRQDLEFPILAAGWLGQVGNRNQGLDSWLGLNDGEVKISAAIGFEFNALDFYGRKQPRSRGTKSPNFADKLSMASCPFVASHLGKSFCIILKDTWAHHHQMVFQRWKISCQTSEFRRP
jgi:hypothetical protein